MKIKNVLFLIDLYKLIILKEFLNLMKNSNGFKSATVI